MASTLSGYPGHSEWLKMQSLLSFSSLGAVGVERLRNLNYKGPLIIWGRNGFSELAQDTLSQFGGYHTGEVSQQCRQSAVD